MKNHQSLFPWYLAGVASQFITHGLHNVLFAWLVAVYLNESGERLGFAQMCAQLPGLLLILFGGVMADRYDRRRILVLCHLLASLPVFLLVALDVAGLLSYTVLIAYAVLVGTFNAFMLPARDSLLNQVSGSNLQRAVTLTMGLGFATQIVGFSLAGLADRIGSTPLLCIQGLLVLAGMLFALKLPSFVPVRESLEAARKAAMRGQLAQIGDGLKLVLASERMAPVMILMVSVGICYSGAFFVVNPIVVRDIYGGGAGEIALSYVCFMAGTIVTTAILIAIGGVIRQGLGLMLALLSGGFFLALTSLGLPFLGYLVCIAAWGVCGGFAMSLGRSIIQESAPAAFRARAMSIYSLGNLGGMPIGSISSGFLTEAIGPLETYLVAVSGIAVTVALTWVTTRIVHVDRLPV